MIDWGVATWNDGDLPSRKGHAIIYGEAACGTYGLYQDGWHILETLPAPERPGHEHFNSICKRCDAHVRKNF